MSLGKPELYGFEFEESKTRHRPVAMPNHLIVSISAWMDAKIHLVKGYTYYIYFIQSVLIHIKFHQSNHQIKNIIKIIEYISPQETEAHERNNLHENLVCAYCIKFKRL
jgi:hypothetical protein